MELSCQIVAFAAYEELIRDIRFEVFVDEQKVPAELEMDGRDAECEQALAFDGDSAVGTGRLLPDGHIGRVAVRAPYRSHGVGRLIMECLIGRARERGFAKVALSAQVSAQGFYERLGFVAHGPIYLDAGIDHVDMTLTF